MSRRSILCCSFAFAFFKTIFISIFGLLIRENIIKLSLWEHTNLISPLKSILPAVKSYHIRLGHIEEISRNFPTDLYSKIFTTVCSLRESLLSVITTNAIVGWEFLFFNFFILRNSRSIFLSSPTACIQKKNCSKIIIYGINLDPY